jgi:CrcB protein
MTGLALALSVAGAGGLGAVSRYLIDLVVNRRFTTGVPKGTITVNVIGSFIFGLTAGLIAHHHLASINSLIIGTGFCGGLTTASSAAFEAARLYLNNQKRDAATIITVGMTLSCLGAAAGLGIALF